MSPARLVPARSLRVCRSASQRVAPGGFASEGLRTRRCPRPEKCDQTQCPGGGCGPVRARLVSRNQTTGARTASAAHQGSGGQKGDDPHENASFLGRDDRPARHGRGRRAAQDRRDGHPRGPIHGARRRRHPRRQHRHGQVGRHRRRARDRADHRRHRRQPRKRDPRRPQAGRAGRRRDRHRPALRLRRHRHARLRQGPPGRDLHQRLLGRAGDHVRRSGGELLPLQHGRRPVVGGPWRVHLQRKGL